MNDGASSAFDPWDRIDASSWPVRAAEPSGSEGAQWLTDPEGNRWLHKNIEVKAGNRQGEDWAEVLSTSVARLLGIPVAQTRLCHRNGVEGSLSLSIRPDNCDLWSGGELLVDTFPDSEYEPGIKKRDGVTKPGHSLPRIRDALRLTAPPPGAPSACTDGFDCFVGYLVLDAIIANRDRHEENWAVLVPRLGDHAPQLAPSFDHGSALGFGETDRRRAELLAADQRLHSWSSKGTAWRMEHERKPQTLVALAVTASEQSSEPARSHWHNVIKNADISSIIEVVRALDPQVLSYPSRSFALAVIETNLRRIRDEFDRR